MSKERELLKRVRDTLLELKETHYDLYWDIQTALDHPSVDLREPLSEDKLDALAEANITDEGIAGYYLGFRDAEKAHGIGGEPLSNEQKRLEAIAIKQREAHGFGGGNERFT